MLFFKTKKQKEFEELADKWKTAINTAVAQLESSNCKHEQSKSFMLYMHYFYENDIERLQNAYNILTNFINAKLHDGTPLLSKFYIYLRDSSTSHYSMNYSMNISIHDESLVKFIDEIGFASVSMYSEHLYETKTAVSQVSTHCIPCDTWRLKEAAVDSIVKVCDQYYKQLEQLKTLLSSSAAASIVRKYSHLYWNGAAFHIIVDVTPERVNEITEYLKKCNVQYVNEYREYLIQQLAENSLTTKCQYDKKSNEYHDVKTVDNIEYDIPHSKCEIYSVFEASHIVKLNRQAKNQEHKAIINEIREAAKQRLAE